jgi:iron(III) transport system substrate-binding protein
MDGAYVKVVYMEEGTVFLDAGVEIIKGAKNLENAKKFVDFVTSKEVQDALGQELTNRPLRKDATLGDHMKPIP